jgi:hypothetical protein
MMAKPPTAEESSCNRQANREIGPFFGEQPDVA